MLETPTARKYPITKENAAEFARRSVEARERRRNRERLAALAVVGLADQSTQVLDGPASTPESAENDSSRDYHAARLLSVRAQLALIDQRLLRDPGPREAAMLSQASQRLTDVEFALCNKPKPAAAKISGPGRKRIDLEAESVPVS